MPRPWADLAYEPGESRIRTLNESIRIRAELQRWDSEVAGEVPVAGGPMAGASASASVLAPGSCKTYGVIASSSVCEPKGAVWNGLARAVGEGGRSESCPAAEHGKHHRRSAAD